MYTREPEANLLTMGLIGCLPDNVQQAIKSFSIRAGKQHLTFIFPFMEETIKTFTDNHGSPRNCNFQPKEVMNSTSSIAADKGSKNLQNALFFDECLEVVHGFKTYITLLPQNGSRNCLPVVELTLYQRDTQEGIFRHFQSLLKIILDKRSSSVLKRLPYFVVDMDSKLLENILNVCVETIMEFQGDTLNEYIQGHEDIPNEIKNKYLRPKFLPYRDFLKRNIDDTVGQLTTTDPQYFTSVLDLLQAPGCNMLHLKKVDTIFKNPNSEKCIKDFWKIWGHDEIARRVFPSAFNTASNPGAPISLFDKLVGNTRQQDTSLENGCRVINKDGSEHTVSVGPISHVPLKEGLQSVIKCLKSQDTSFAANYTEVKRSPRSRSCTCGTCKTYQSNTPKSTRFVSYETRFLQHSRSLSGNGVTDRSAFHLPCHHTYRVPGYDTRPVRRIREAATVTIETNTNLRYPVATFAQASFAQHRYETTAVIKKDVVPLVVPPRKHPLSEQSEIRTIETRQNTFIQPQASVSYQNGYTQYYPLSLRFHQTPLQFHYNGLISGT